MSEHSAKNMEEISQTVALQAVRSVGNLLQYYLENRLNPLVRGMLEQLLAAGCSLKVEYEFNKEPGIRATVSDGEQETELFRIRLEQPPQPGEQSH